MWAFTTSIWAVTSTVCAVTASMWAVAAPIWCVVCAVLRIEPMEMQDKAKETYAKHAERVERLHKNFFHSFPKYAQHRIVNANEVRAKRVIKRNYSCYES